MSECQGVIKDVIKDMAKGRPFPTCSFVSENGLLGENAVTTRNFTTTVRAGKLCPDNSKPYKTVGSISYCRAIEINIDPQFAADPNHQKQEFYY